MPASRPKRRLAALDRCRTRRSRSDRSGQDGRSALLGWAAVERANARAVRSMPCPDATPPAANDLGGCPRSEERSPATLPTSRRPPPASRRPPPASWRPAPGANGAARPIGMLRFGGFPGVAAHRTSASRRRCEASELDDGEPPRNAPTTTSGLCPRCRDRAGPRPVVVVGVLGCLVVARRCDWWSSLYGFATSRRVYG